MHIRVLKKLFDELPMHPSNMGLYQELLSLDMVEFKPIMEAILDGRIDIEDTRQILRNRFITEFGKLFENPKDPRISRSTEALVQTMKDNITKRLFDNGKDVVKENIGFFRNLDDYKNAVANAYYEETSRHLSDEDIARIVPIMEQRYVQELNMANLGGGGEKENKKIQLKISDLLAHRPNT